MKRRAFISSAIGGVLAILGLDKVLKKDAADVVFPPISVSRQEWYASYFYSNNEEDSEFAKIEWDFDPYATKFSYQIDPEFMVVELNFTPPKDGDRI